MATAPDHTASIATLKEAFPDTDIEVIEMVFQESRGNTETAFNYLLSLSDPEYKLEHTETITQTNPEAQEQYVRSQTVLTSTSADQLASDEALARALAEENSLPPRHLLQTRGEAYPENAQYQNQYQYQQQQQPLAPQFNFQEEFEPIKQKAIEGAQVAKKKVIELYNQFKSRTGPVMSSSSGLTNPQYRNLPGDEDFLSAEQDLSALSLSDNDVATRTTGSRQSPFTREERLAEQQNWLQEQRNREHSTVEEEDRLQRRHSPPKGYQIDDIPQAPVLPAVERPAPLHATTVTDELIDDDDDQEEIPSKPTMRYEYRSPNT